VGVTRDGVVVVHHDRALNPDLARGPEDTAVYLQVGNAWFRP